MPKNKNEKKNKDTSKIDELKTRLHARRFQSKPKNIRSRFYSRTPEVAGDWDVTHEAPEDDTSDAPFNPMLKKIFFASILFFVAAASVAAYLFIGGGNVVSSENVNIEVLGPVSIAGGEELSLQVSITNNNNAQLRLADLSVEFPEGTHEPGDLSQELSRHRKSLGEINSGETVNEIIRAVLFGEEGQEKRIRIAVEYRVAGSNAIFVKEKDYTVSISSAPVSVKLETLSEVNANQEIELLATISSNSEQTIKNLALQMQYPFGFEPSEANPEPTHGTSIWELGDMGPNDEKTIRISGTLRGQDNEERVFSAFVGKQDPQNERKVATVFSSSFAPIQIKKPFIGFDLTLNDSKSQTYTARAGERISARMNWQSNLSEKAENVVIEAELNGDVDAFSVEASQGFFNSSENKIVWNQTTFDSLEEVNPGDGNTLRFSFRPLTGADIKNPEIDISVNVSARRIAERAKSEKIENVLQRTVIASSDLRLVSRGVHFSGPFNNTGSMPPKAEDTTTYTVLWTITNPENNVSNAQVTAKLPPAVSWTGLTDPGGANVSYNANTRTVTWNAGDIAAGAGFQSVSKELAFQVALTPSVSDIGSSPRIIQDISLNARDNFTNSDIEYTRPPITTNINTDPSFTGGQGQVAE